MLIYQSDEYVYWTELVSNNISLRVRRSIVGVRRNPITRIIRIALEAFMTAGSDGAIRQNSTGAEYSLCKYKVHESAI